MTLIGIVALAVQIARPLQYGPEVALRGASFRYWRDLDLATGYLLVGRFPVSASCQPVGDERPPLEIYASLFDQARGSEVSTWRPWRTFVPRGFTGPCPIALAQDDLGQALTLALAFRALGGVAPFLPFWIGWAVASALFSWIALELTRAGQPVVAAILCPLLGCSVFLADVLALTYGPQGYYVLALLAVLPLATYATLSARPSPRGLLFRTFAAGVVVAILSAFRGGAIAAFGGLALALVIAAARMVRIDVRRGLITGAICAAALALPLLGVRAGLRTVAEGGGHHLWYGVWIGLGDFDRTHGHVWRDQAVNDVIASRLGAGPRGSHDVFDPRVEPMLRSLILDEVRSDPVWYLEILGKRLVHTVAQVKLWPHRVFGGPWFAPATHPNEGVIDIYYGMTRSPEFLWLGLRIVEVPIQIWMLGVLGLFRPTIRKVALTPLLCLAAAALPLPVLVTTASGVEAQAFGLLYLVLAAFVLGDLAERRGVASWRSDSQIQEQ